MNNSSNLIIQNKKTERRISKLKQNDFLYFFSFSFPKGRPVDCRHNNELDRKNGFAQRAKLAQKLRWRKGTESNFCDKVFIGFENHVM